MRTNRAPAVAAAAVLLLLPACSGGAATDGAGSDGAGQCPAPTPAAEASALPSTLDLGAFGTVTEVVRQRGFVNATAIAQGSLDDLQERFSRALQRSGYAIVGSENEVIEADVFFARGQATTGGAKFIQTSCEDRVRIQLFIGGQGTTG